MSLTEFEWHALTLILAVVALVEGLVLASTLRHVGAILLRMGPETYGEVEEGPSIGQTVSDASVPEPPGILLFVSQTCSLCKPLVGRLPTLRRGHPGVQLVPVAIGDSGPAKRKFVASLGQGARGDLDELYRQWAIPGTPYGVAIGPDSTIRARGVVNTVEQVEVLVDAAIGPADLDASRAPSDSALVSSAEP